MQSRIFHFKLETWYRLVVVIEIQQILKFHMFSIQQSRISHVLLRNAFCLRHLFDHDQYTHTCTHTHTPHTHTHTLSHTRDAVLSLLCHSYEFPCQQRVLKMFPGPGYLYSDDGVHSLTMTFFGKFAYIYYVYNLIYIYILA